MKPKEKSEPVSPEVEFLNSMESLNREIEKTRIISAGLKDLAETIRRIYGETENR